MTKTGKLSARLGFLFVLLSAGVRGQTPSPYVLTAPTTDQTIQQGNNALILGGQGILKLGDTYSVGLSAQSNWCCGGYGFGLLSVDAESTGDGMGTLSIGALALGQPNFANAVIAPSEDQFYSPTLYFQSFSGGQVFSIPASGAYWGVQENNGGALGYTLMCATTAQDWVGIGSDQYGCVPYDEFDVNNQVQIGDNNSGAFAHIHFTSPAIAGTLYSNQNPAYYQNLQNAGITNCANGTLCLDGSRWSARLEMCQWIRDNWTRRAYGTRQEVPA